MLYDAMHGTHPTATLRRGTAGTVIFVQYTVTGSILLCSVCVPVLRVAPVPVLHGADPAHHPDADGERARVDRGVSGRGLPALPATQVDRDPHDATNAVHEPKIQSNCDFLQC